MSKKHNAHQICHTVSGKSIIPFSCTGRGPSGEQQHVHDAADPDGGRLAVDQLHDAVPRGRHRRRRNCAERTARLPQGLGLDRSGSGDICAGSTL